ncbi:MAG: hypothetical protein ACK5DE_10965, partial [Bacteroidota bacterium]
KVCRFGAFGGWHRVCFSGVVMSTTIETSNATSNATSAKTFGLSSAPQSAKAHYDDAVALMRHVNQTEIAAYWAEQRNRVLSAFGAVRTKSVEGSATKGGIDYGSASLTKVLRHLGTPKREGAFLSAAWAMVHAATVE